MRKMDVKPSGLMLIHNFRPGPTGGSEIQAERLACGLVSLGHPMQILTNPISVANQWYDFGGNIPYAPEEEVFYGTGADESLPLMPDDKVKDVHRGEGVRVHRLFRLAYGVNQGVTDTFRYLVKNRKTYDVLHCHMAYGHAVVAVVAARTLGKRCIIKIACAGEFGEFYTFSKFAGFSRALHVLHQADAMIAVSREVEEELLGYGFSQKRILRISNGVDTRFFQPRVQAERPGKLRFLLVGRRQPQKGVDLLLEAIQTLKLSGLEDKFEVQLYGSDSPDYDYRSMAADFGVAHLVDFLPFQKDMRHIYQEVQSFLLPSRGEGLSNALLEAMAMGLPVVATRVSGTPDVVTNEKDGLLIPPESSEALADAMKRIILDPALRQQLGQNARRRVEDEFSMEHVARQYSDLYSRLCHFKS
jgi:glycosyltransferase involved in cell wall biosynthesis